MRDLLRHINARDVHFYAGVGLVAAGFYCVYPPLALIAPGVVFLYVSLRGCRHGNPRQHRTAEYDP